MIMLDFLFHKVVCLNTRIFLDQRMMMYLMTRILEINQVFNWLNILKSMLSFLQIFVFIKNVLWLLIHIF